MTKKVFYDETNLEEEGEAETSVDRSPVELSLKTFSYVQGFKDEEGTYLIHILHKEEQIGFVRITDPKVLRHLRLMFSKESQDNARRTNPTS